jgi:hypothetical protein
MARTGTCAHSFPAVGLAAHPCPRRHVRGRLARTGSARALRAGRADARRSTRLGTGPLSGRQHRAGRRAADLAHAGTCGPGRAPSLTQRTPAWDSSSPRGKGTRTPTRDSTGSPAPTVGRTRLVGADPQVCDDVRGRLRPRRRPTCSRTSRRRSVDRRPPAPAPWSDRGSSGGAISPGSTLALVPATLIECANMRQSSGRSGRH